MPSTFSWSPNGWNVLRLNRGGAIEGTAVDERGAPVTAYLVGVESFHPRATPARQWPAIGTQSFERLDGSFRLETSPRAATS